MKSLEERIKAREQRRKEAEKQQEELAEILNPSKAKAKRGKDTGNAEG